MGLWLAFVQTARHLAIGRVGKVLSPLIVPVAVAAVWRVALDLHWWTIVAFVFVALVVGTINGFAIRSTGKASIYSMQPLVGLLAVGCVGTSWALRYV